MIKYLETYQQQLENLNNFKRSMMNSLVVSIKTINVNPLFIGNMVYYYTEYRGKEVPAYCYKTDYGETNPTFLPIYDEDNTGEFGWSDFNECCRIFDVITDTLYNISNLKQLKNYGKVSIKQPADCSIAEISRNKSNG